MGWLCIKLLFCLDLRRKLNHIEITSVSQLKGMRRGELENCPGKTDRGKKLVKEDRERERECRSAEMSVAETGGRR